ncbi:Ig-like domain-containing protein [Cnuibacter sp. UC19_7]|uniref:Ig-like domain-containing protein n=1 Tax=Cnuibacter sp. UC19_7 TaxID=3350166 RepID=UPI00366A60F9
MRLFETIRHHKAATATVATTAALAIGVTTMAFVYQGVTTADVELNDGGVWVTKPSALLVGHLNAQAQVLDGGTKMGSSSFDILQSGDTVLSVDTATATMTTIDPVTVSLGNPVTLPESATVSLGDQTVAVVEGESGLLWAMPASQAPNFLADPDNPTYDLGSGGTATVGVDGVVHGLDRADAQLVDIPMLDNGQPGDPVTHGLPTIPENAQLTLTSVGSQGVLFDSATGTVVTDSGSTIEVPDAQGGIVQKPGPDSDVVLIATESSLIEQPLSGGDPVVVDAGKPGTPTAPVSMGGCAYSAWAGSGAYVRDCAGDDDDVSQQVEGMSATAQLTFRVNRNVVVLNDLSTGTVWLVDQDMKKVDNWDDIAPPPDETQTNEEDDSTQEELQVLLPERSEQNNPPVAQDDQFGVRAGRTVILPVIDNDSDPDGDLLTATVDGGGDLAIGRVERILNGAALQIAVNPDASGNATFTYTIDDGRGGTDSATVTLSVKAPGENDAPTQKRVPTVLAELGSTVTYNALPDWIDPDGDDLFVRSAVAQGANQVQFTPDGKITFTSLDPDPGRKDITVTVSDGKADTEGTIHVEVRDVGTLGPVTNNDLVVAKAGEPVTVSPLQNDSSPSGAPLRLAKVNEVPGATILPDYTTGTFSFTAPAAGQYYTEYLVTNGPKSASGLIRIVVEPADDSDAPPVAVQDRALLPVGRSTLVNVLANDTDPNGKILGVQSVNVPEDSGISVEVLEHETLRVTDTAGRGTPVTFTYTVTNGTKSAVGEVFVLPIAPPDRLRPPVATDDEVSVRAGDVTTINVLANDYHPDGDTISLSPTLVEPLIDPADGDLFVDQNTLRFKAGPNPKTVYATYEVVDSQGQKDAGYVTIHILAADGQNSPPRPQDVTVRALQGTTVRIPIPLNGIDPDGDSVTLVGQDTAPSKGRITEVGEAWLVYEAYPDAVGTDTFTYKVRDHLGATATASVLVGIIPSGSANQRPYAQKDTVSVRPGRTVAVDVMANDSDPDGDPIAIRENGLEVPAGVTASVAGGRVLVQAPQEPGDYPITYTIVDQYGATAVGNLVVTVSPDATLLSPIARDDTVPIADMVDRTFVDVNVRENDDDPDGTIEALQVTSADPAATPQSDGMLRIDLLPTSQIITYTVTDQDGLTASAFVFVPGVDSLPPTLKPGIEPIEVNSGENIQLNLSDYVLVAEGKTPRITQTDRVSASHSDGSALVASDATLSYTSAQGYYGPDAISFEVTDGTGPDDPAGKKAVLVLPISVVSTTNISPTFLGTTIDVAPGEEASAPFNLRTISRDPDQGDLEKLQYSVQGQLPQGISVDIDGQNLTARAAGNAAQGPNQVTIQVTDGTSQPTTGTLVVNVLTSTRPLPSATDDVVPQANQGQTVNVDVLSNDFNPYPESPLTIVSSTVETGNGNSSVNGSQVAVTPAADFVGTMVVRYRIQDTTGDPNRQSEGRIRLTVQGRPDTIGTPGVTSIQDQTVVLSWAPPINNGAEIQYYTVSSNQGFSQQCASTTCTLSGLTNNVEYTFTVTATNSVGTSDPSPASAPARPDAKPDQPQPPTLVFGDKALTVNWVPPTTHGSPVESYNLEISPAPARGALSKTGVTGTSVVWEGLDNGTAYQVRVQAVNRAPDPSDWSGWSAAEIPAGKPDVPAAPSVSRVDGVGSQVQMKVSWTAPASNGDAVSSYVLSTYRGGALADQITVAGTNQNVTVATSESDYTFTVAATNKAGTSDPSAQSTPRRAFTPPGAPTLTNASEGDGQITNITYSPGALNGARGDEVTYQYRLNGGGWSNLGASGSSVPASNNGTYSIDLRAVTTADGSTYGSNASNAIGNLRPYGPPGAPSVQGQNGTQSVSFSWTAPGPNGRDIVGSRYRINGGGWNAAGPNGNVSAGNDYDQSFTIEVQVQDSNGTWSDTRSASANTSQRPQPKVYISRGGSCSSQSPPPSGSGGVKNCYMIRVTLEGWDGGGNATCTWDSSQGGFTESIPKNGSKQTLWWSEDTPGTGYSLESNASKIRCDGIQAQARR